MYNSSNQHFFNMQKTGHLIQDLYIKLENMYARMNLFEKELLLVKKNMVENLNKDTPNSSVNSDILDRINMLSSEMINLRETVEVNNMQENLVENILENDLNSASFDDDLSKDSSEDNDEDDDEDDEESENDDDEDDEESENDDDEDDEESENDDDNDEDEDEDDDDNDNEEASIVADSEPNPISMKDENDGEDNNNDEENLKLNIEEIKPAKKRGRPRKIK